VKIVVVLLLVALIAGIPAGAEATRVKITVNNGSDAAQGPLHQSSATRAHAYPDPRLPYPDPRLQYPDPRRRPTTDHRPVAPALPVIVITQPVYLAAPPSCVVPGYWAYTWVPQSYVSSVWVPSHYNYDAVWVEGHYEARAYSWGYYQPYWVPDGTC
jgi:hypothetical protein